MAATRHLLAAGHRRIGFLGGLDGLMLEQRLSGCRAAFADAGLAFDEDLVFSASPTRTGGHDAMRSLLAAQPAIKAAICYNDLVAFGALSALDENGLRAGKDFALMGFDNVFDAAHSHPLSTVDVRPAELGEQAATLLLARMAHPGQPASSCWPGQAGAAPVSLKTAARSELARIPTGSTALSGMRSSLPAFDEPSSWFHEIRPLYFIDCRP